MPDGDIVHKGLGHRWQIPYKQVCEWSLSEDEITLAILKPLQKELQKFGEEPLRYIDAIVEQLQGFAAEPVLKHPGDWLELTDQIEVLAQELCNPPAAAVAQKTCSQLCNEVHAGMFSGGLPELRIAAYEKYLLNLYISNFEGRVPLNPEHYGDVDHHTIEKRLASLRPYIQQGINPLARQIAQNGLFNIKMRIPTLKIDRNVDADTEIPLLA